MKHHDETTQLIPNYNTKRIMAQIWSTEDSLSLLEAPKLREVTRKRRIHQSRLSLLTLGLSLLLAGCGGESSRSLPQSAASKPTNAEVEALSPEDCSKSPLVGQWHTGSSGYDADTLVISPKCLWQTYACDTLAYIASDPSNAVGIVTIEVVYEGKGCLGIGAHQCSYDARDTMDKTMMLKCH